MATQKELIAGLEVDVATRDAEIEALKARLAEAGQAVEGLPVPPPDEDEATNVIEAINRVKRDLPGIGKVDSAAGVPYAFRGIETLVAHLQPLTQRHGVVIAPVGATELASGYEYLSSTNKVWHESHIHYKWAVYGPGGVTDVIYGESIGYGRDDQDKGASKAQTQAYKEFMVKLFCIGDKSADPDGTTPEAMEGQQRGNDTNGRTFGTGQPPVAQNLHDWHALGWAEKPLPSGGSDERDRAIEMHDKALDDVTSYLKEHLGEDEIKQLLKDRKAQLGPLPLSVTKMKSWDVMATAAVEATTKGDGSAEDPAGADLFTGSQTLDEESFNDGAEGQE